MVSLVNASDWLTLSAAARLLPHRPHPSSLWRWCRDGTKEGVRLEHITIGGRVLTTEAALSKFLQETTAAVQARHEQARAARAAERDAMKAATPKPASERKRQREIAAAYESLRRQGVKV